MQALERKKRRHKTWVLMKRNWILYLFMLPTFLWLLIFHYVPIYGVQIAFQNFKPGQAFGTSEWVGLKYFKQFFESYWFPVVMKNTITISLLSFVLGFFPPIILALLLNEVKNMKLPYKLETEYANNIQKTYAELKESYVGKEFYNPTHTLAMTEEEQEAASIYETDIDSYVKERVSRWIAGEEELNDTTWNAYIQQLKDMKVDKLTEAYVSAHNRFFGVK